MAVDCPATAGDPVSSEVRRSTENRPCSAPTPGAQSLDHANLAQSRLSDSRRQVSVQIETPQGTRSETKSVNDELKGLSTTALGAEQGVTRASVSGADNIAADSRPVRRTRPQDALLNAAISFIRSAASRPATKVPGSAPPKHIPDVEVRRIAASLHFLLLCAGPDRPGSID